MIFTGEAVPDPGSEPADDTTSDSGDGAAGDTGGDAGPLVATAEVPVEGGSSWRTGKVVVTQPAESTVKAFTAICTHQACTVASVKQNVISCPCHGSAFSAEDGSVENGPASRPLREIPAQWRATRSSRPEPEQAVDSRCRTRRLGHPGHCGDEGGRWPL